MVMEIIVSMILLFVGIAVLVVIHVCIVGRAFRDENGNEVQIPGLGRSNRGIPKMSKEDLKSLPCFDYEAAEKGSPVDCVVCLENFRKGDKCRMLPNCKHSFHAHCIDSWLLKTPICPLCRTCANPGKVTSFLAEEMA